MTESTIPAGLSEAEANKRLSQCGANILPEPPMPGVIHIFFRQFLSPFIYILVIAAVTSFALSHIPSGVFILAVLVLNATIGTLQEYSAQRSASALRNMVRGVTHVIRDGIGQKIDVEKLVPDDLILLSSGDKVPADIRLVRSQNLAVDESMLTGESLAVSKSADIKHLETPSISERTNECFAGTIITHGRAHGIVTATGIRTEIGSIAEHVGAERTSEPPLMIRIRRFTYQVALAILMAITLLAAIMLIKGGYTVQGILLMAIGLVVSTIPEGLPAALTVSLAIGMRRMAKRNVIIRKLVAVEALGSCTFICSDKTGTLTVNELTIRAALLPNGNQFEIHGEGVTSGGKIIGDNIEQLRELCVTGVLANESHLDYSGGEWVSDGDIVDVAFLVFAKKLGLSLSQTARDLNQVELIPYESERAFSGSLNKSGDKHIVYVKGSPEKILSMSSLMLCHGKALPIDAPRIEKQFEQLAEQGFRVIALAHREAGDGGALDNLNNMVFLGMVAMIDPVRPEAKDAIRRCITGGIQVAMVTGDHPATAKAIAIELGMCDSSSTPVTGVSIHDAIAKGHDAAEALILPARVFARIEPQQKEYIVETFMKHGHFVAVTGDGVNDAPAMRGSNVGIAMGKRGTDVARETADLIIADDNFSSIVNGIEEGRVVYNNIRKVIALLIATGFSAILLFFGCVAAGLPMPMTAIQLLWLNLVANGLQDVALAFEPKEGGELDTKPRSPSEPIFNKRIIEYVLLTGCVMGGLAFLVYFVLTKQGVSLDATRNLTLMLMVLFGNIHALNSRSETRSIFSIPLASNIFLILAIPLAQILHISAMYIPGINTVLGLQPISLNQWGVLLLIALSLLIIVEAHKYWHRFRNKTHTV